MQEELNVAQVNLKLTGISLAIRDHSKAVADPVFNDKE
jgi:hypothetical protein